MRKAARLAQRKRTSAPMLVNRLGESRSCPALSLVLNSRGYAQTSVGSGASTPRTHPGGVYSVADSSSPSARL